jgi:predicted membrane GTPase involved in stress response
MIVGQHTRENDLEVNVSKWQEADQFVSNALCPHERKKKEKAAGKDE